jgi:hypothetical protein
VKSQPHLLTDREKIDERKEQSNKLGSEDIAHTIISIVEMRKGFIPEVTIWATNPLNNNRDIYLKVNDSIKPIILIVENSSVSITGLLVRNYGNT